MIEFEVNDMTCGHCASTIAKAVKAVDSAARVDIDLTTHRVRVEPETADADGLAEAIREAGYSPKPVPVPVPLQGQAADVVACRPAGACCGCR